MCNGAGGVGGGGGGAGDAGTAAKANKANGGGNGAGDAGTAAKADKANGGGNGAGDAGTAGKTSSIPTVQPVVQQAASVEPAPAPAQDKTRQELDQLIKLLEAAISSQKISTSGVSLLA